MLRRVQLTRRRPSTFYAGACMSHSFSHEIITIAAPSPRAHVLLRSFVIGLTAFLTVVDLFATQALLPSLARHYNVSPAAMGFAVNASTMGMAMGALLVAFASANIPRRTGIFLSLALLSIRLRFSPLRPICRSLHSYASCRAFACPRHSR